jgi:acetate---CoA ligase (ADP-forming)
MSNKGASITADRDMFRSPASVLAPSSVAIVGASERGQWQGMIYRNLREFKFPGRVLLVNPRQTEVWGEKCYPSLRELPERVDHAMVIVPAPAVADVLEDAAAA